MVDAEDGRGTSEDEKELARLQALSNRIATRAEMLLDEVRAWSKAVAAERAVAERRHHA